MTRITIDARLINNSGIGTYIRNLLPLITEILNHCKFSFLIDTKKINSYECFLNKHNIDLIDCDCPLYSIHEQYKVLRRIPSNTDIFWSPHYVIPILYPGKILTTIHDVCHLSFSDSSSFMKRIYAKNMMRMSSLKSHNIITVSNFSKYEILRYTSIDPSKIKVIYNGINVNIFNTLDTYEKSLSCPYILFLGNVKPNKNLLGLLSAFEEIMRSIPHNLIIIGKKEGFINDDPKVFEYAKKFGNRIEFTGFIEDSELINFLHNASALVFPSLYEGFGFPPLEAMACGCPVAVSAAAAMPEICGESALYFDPYNSSEIADKIYKLVTNESLAQSLVEKGKIRVGHFTWERCAEETCTVIDRILSAS